MSRLIDTGFVKELSRVGGSLIEEQPRINILPTIQRRLEEPVVKQTPKRIIETKREVYSNIMNILMFFGIILMVYIILQFKWTQKQAEKPIDLEKSLSITLEPEENPIKK